MFKKVISAVLMVTIAFGGMIMLTSCNAQQTKQFTLKFITTPLYENGKVSETPYTVTWDKETFEKESSQFSPELAKTALVMCATAYSYTYALDNFDTMEFEHKAKFNYGENYDENAVGMIIASKEIEDTTVVVITLRGTLKKEWYSNFDIGKNIRETNVHQGFDNARNFALEKLKMFIGNYGIDRDHTKFLVTGHSRGAAVANLLSKSLIDTYGTDNVYAYTFATPNTTLDSEANSSRYSSIFNFVNPEDFIAHIPLSQWGFTKYGTTINFPSRDTDENFDSKEREVAEIYEKYKGRPFKSFGGTKSQEEFMNTAFELAPTIKDYYDTKYDIAGLKLSLYEYMNVLGALLNEENIISNGMILLGSQGSPFEGLTNYITSGMDTQSDAFSIDYEDSLIGYAHTAEAYLALLEVYINHM